MTHPKIDLYEAHVTIEPVFDERLKEFEEVCKAYGFKAAKLMMQKARAETPERSNRDSFCTGHGDNYDEILERVMKIVTRLHHLGFKVWRYKIEGILLDVRL